MINEREKETRDTQLLAALNMLGKPVKVVKPGLGTQDGYAGAVHVSDKGRVMICVDFWGGTDSYEDIEFVVSI